MSRDFGLKFGCAWILVLATTSASRGDEPVKLPAPASRPVDFGRDVAPLLERRCYACHGPKKQKAGLALHDQAKAMAGGDGGAVIVPGK